MNKRLENISQARHVAIQHFARVGRPEGAPQRLMLLPIARDHRVLCSRHCSHAFECPRASKIMRTRAAHKKLGRLRPREYQKSPMSGAHAKNGTMAKIVLDKE